MITHDRESDAVNRKDGRQMFQPIASPLASMFEILPRQRVLATKKGPADTAVPDVDDLNLSRIDRSFPGSASHGPVPPQQSRFRLKATPRSQGKAQSLLPK